MSMKRCPVVTIWHEVPPHGVRLTCSLPAGHSGDHGCADVEYLEQEPAACSCTPDAWCGCAQTVDQIDSLDAEVADLERGLAT